MPRSKVKEPEHALLDLTQSQFLALSDQKAVAMVQLESQLQRQKAWHAFFGILFGTTTYLASLGACVYLALHGFPKLAAMALGAPVLTVIKRIVGSRI